MSKKVTLKGSDGEMFEIDEAVAFESETIKHMIEDFTDNGEIQLPNVKSKILAKVIDYCKKHVESPRIDEELRIWDEDFVKVDQETLLDLVRAANFLNIKGLLGLTCQAVADMIKGKTPAQIRDVFNVRSEFAPEEEEEVRRENQWAFE